MPIVTTSSKRRSRRHSPLSPIHYALAVVALLAIAVAIYFLGKNPSPSVPQVPDPPVPTEPSPVPATNPEAEAPSDAPEEPDTATAPDPSTLQPFNPSTNSVPVSSPTNSPGRPPKRFGKPKGAPRVNTVEQVLFMALSSEDGGGMPPLPIDDNASLTNAFLAAMTNSIVIYDTDDERTVALKERVADAKNQLKKIYEEGGSIYDALMEYQHYVNEGAQIRSEVIRHYMRLRKEASPEEAEAYRLEANKELEREGIAIIGPMSGRARP